MHNSYTPLFYPLSAIDIPSKLSYLYYTQNIYFMRKSMNKLQQYTEFIAEKGAKIIGIFILAWLTYWQAIRTFRMPTDDYDKEYILEHPDSPVRNLIFAFLFILVLFLLQKMILRGDSEQQRKKLLILAIVDIIIVGILLTIWVSTCRIEPYWDQLQVLLTSQKFRIGDYSDMDILYFQMYTQQYGLIFFEELLLGIWNDYRIFQYINVIFIMAIIFFFYKVTDLMFDNPGISFYSLIGITLFIPMYFYVVYIYGDLGSIALCLIAIWGLLKWNTSGKLRYLPIIFLSTSIATLIRNNSLIILIAILIVSVIYACKIWNWRPLAIGITIMALSLLSTSLVEGYYELRSGKEIGEGLPFTVWFSMGLQEEWAAVGLDSGYDESIWWQCNSDPEATSERAMEDLKNKLRELKADPAHAKELLRYKALEQWIEPTFSSITLTGKFDEAANPVVEEIYFGVTTERICKFMNYFLFVLYLCALIHTVRGLFHKEGIYSCLMLIVFIGGFLFGMIWEAKGRYMMPYAMILIPYMACGIFHIQNGCSTLAKKFIPNKNSDVPSNTN